MAATWAASRASMHHRLAREHQARRAVAVFDRHAPGRRGLDRIAGPPQVHVRNEAQARQMLDGLMRRAVFAEADGIVGIDEDHAQAHQRRHAHGIARIVRKRQERAGVRE